MERVEGREFYSKKLDEVSANVAHKKPDEIIGMCDMSAVCAAHGECVRAIAAAANLRDELLYSEEEALGGVTDAINNCEFIRESARLGNW